MIGLIPPIPVVAAVIKEKRSDGVDRYLVCLRSGKDDSPSSKNFTGMWEFPGGKKLIAEQDHEALEREIQEELGVKVEVGEKLHTGRVKGDSDGKEYQVVFYLCKIVGIPTALVHSKIMWVTLPQMENLKMPPLCEEIRKTLKEEKEPAVGKKDITRTGHVIYKTAMSDIIKVECLTCGLKVLAVPSGDSASKEEVEKLWEKMTEEMVKRPHVIFKDGALTGTGKDIKQYAQEALRITEEINTKEQKQIRVPYQYHSQDTPLIGYDPKAAQPEKWRRGQEKYGPGSKPVNPLAHLYEELIDGLNYLDDANRQRHITVAEHQLNTASLRAMAYWARGAHFEREKEK